MANERGMLTQRADMDMGTWNITPNALGETVSQTDAKSLNRADFLRAFNLREDGVYGNTEAVFEGSS